MARFKKRILAEGTYYPEGQNGPAVPFTREKIKAYAETGNQLVGAGLMIPGPFNHSKSALPTNPKASTDSYMNAGYWDKWWTEEEDGKLVLWAEIDAPGDPNDQTTVAGKVGTTVREVSIAGIDEWTDGTGKVWKNVPLHVALCTKPVVPGMGNFEVIAGATAFSFSMGSNVDGDINELRTALLENDIYLPEGVTKDALPRMLLVSLKQRALGKLNTEDTAKVETMPIYFSMESEDMPISKEQAESIVKSGQTNPLTSKPWTMEDLGFKPQPPISVEALAKTAEENTQLKGALSKMRTILTNVVTGNLKQRVQGLINRGVVKQGQVPAIEQQITAFQLSFNPTGDGIAPSPLEQYLDLIESAFNDAEKTAPKKEATQASMFSFSGLNIETPNSGGEVNLSAAEEKELHDFMLAQMHNS